MRRGVEDYGTLRNLTKKMPGFGEVSSWTTCWSSGSGATVQSGHRVDEKGWGGFAVPKERRGARRMLELAGGIDQIRAPLKTGAQGAHPARRREIRTVQEIWDPTCTAADLGRRSSLRSGSRLAENFRTSPRSSVSPLLDEYRRNARFLRETVWPQFAGARRSYVRLTYAGAAADGHARPR